MRAARQKAREDEWQPPATPVPAAEPLEPTAASDRETVDRELWRKIAHGEARVLLLPDKPDELRAAYAMRTKTCGDSSSLALLMRHHHANMPPSGHTPLQLASVMSCHWSNQSSYPRFASDRPDRGCIWQVKGPSVCQVPGGPSFVC